MHASFFFFFFKSEQPRFAVTREAVTSALQQLRTYWQNNTLADRNPLVWWKEIEEQGAGRGLGLLLPVARMYLAIPASSADVERTFSSAGFLLDGRWHILPRNLEMQVIIRDWLLELESSGAENVIEHLEELFQEVFPAAPK